MKTGLSMLVAVLVAGIMMIQPLHAQTYTFSGTIYEFGDGIAQRPLAGATVHLQPGGRETRTGSNGGFALTGVPTGTYVVTVSAPGHTSLVRTVPIIANTVREFALQMTAQTERRYTLSGTVSETGTTIGTRPLGGAIVYLLGTSYSARTDARGAYVIPSVLAGTYTVQVSASGHGTVNRQIGIENATTANFTLPLNGNGSQEGRFTLRGTITGKGSGSSRHAVAGASIRVTPGNYTTTTGSDGSFTIANLPAGTYVVHAKAPGHKAMNQKVSIKADRTIDIRLKMTGNGRDDDDDDRDKADRRHDSSDGNGRGSAKNGKGKGKRK